MFMLITPTAMCSKLNNDEDLPSDIRLWSKYDYARAQNHKALAEMSEDNRWRLMFGLPKLQERPVEVEYKPVEAS